MKIRITALLLICAMAAALMTGCGSASYADGTYEGTSSVYEGDEDGSGAGYGVVTLTISGGKITDCQYSTYEPDGTLKDEDYGKQDGEVANKDFY
ncbi:MAG: FMN-binding protein, partial [Oscillospiraceae bacterium]|nr:FMN-binding protein [Oscillospiraceae bacterium]